MSLGSVLQTAVERIRTGRLNNEAQVKQAVILPILRELDWDDSDPAEFVPEFPVDSGRVDYALLRLGGAPQVFIEAKGLGLATADGEEQVFRYAVNKGVPFLILTDGNFWDFYLSMAEGVPADRRFYRAELTREERIPEYVEFFEEHLRKRRVVSGDARRAAERRRESDRERQKARAAIPDAWRALLEKPEEMLLDLLAEEVGSQCGTRPEPGDVEAFLRGLRPDATPPPTPRRRRTPAARPVTTPPPPPPVATPASDSTELKSKPEPRIRGNKKSKLIGFELDGERMETGTARRTLIEVLKALDRRDPESFMENFARKTRERVRKRRLVARNPAECYPDKPDWRPKDLGNGWWLADHGSTKWVESIIQTACQVAGVQFGSDLKLIER